MFMKLSRYSASFEKKKKKQNNWITPYTRSSIDVFINAFVATDMLVRSYVLIGCLTEIVYKHNGVILNNLSTQRMTTMNK